MEDSVAHMHYLNLKKIFCVCYSQHYVIINKVVSLTPPDPSLTPANLLHATRHIPLWWSGDSYNWLNMPVSQHEEAFDGEKAKQQLFTTWLASHPCPSWEHVEYLLRYGVGGEEGERAADEVKETYLKSELDILGKWSKYTYSFSFNKYNTFLLVTVSKSVLSRPLNC